MTERGHLGMLFVILPAFNEEKALPKLLKQIHRTCDGLDYRIVVVDDGSTDQTAEKVLPFAREPRVVLLRHEENLGLGRALLTGFKYAVREAASLRQNSEGQAKLKTAPWTDVIVTMDADNTHPPELIPLLYARIQMGEDVAIASRYVEGGKQWGLGPWRRFLSWGASTVMQRFFPLPGVQDYSCGYRAYRLSRIREGLAQYGDALMESQNFAAMVEVLLKLAPFCHRFTEIPFELHYERKVGPSKMKVLATILGYFSLIWRLKRLAGLPGGLREESPEAWPEEWVRE